MSLKADRCQPAAEPTLAVAEQNNEQALPIQPQRSALSIPSGDHASVVNLSAGKHDVQAHQGYPAVFTSDGIKARKIYGHDLSLYQRPIIPGNRNALWRAAWYLVNTWCFQSSVPALIPSSWKAQILRAFGAKVGTGFVCKPRVTIKYPWFLEIGDHVWLGELVWFDNHTIVKIGNSVCISQGAYLFTGNHDWNDEGFRFFSKRIEIGDGCWVGAGVQVGPGSFLTAGTVWATSAQKK